MYTTRFGPVHISCLCCQTGMSTRLMIWFCRFLWVKGIARAAAAASRSASKSTANASRLMCGAPTPAGAAQHAICGAGRQRNLATGSIEALDWRPSSRGLASGDNAGRLCCAGARTAGTWGLATPRMAATAASRLSGQRPSACRHAPPRQHVSWYQGLCSLHKVLHGPQMRTERRSYQS
jgi:hypothetical protein